jgi:myo-inositol-1(or 4)-monophosphatase
MADRARQGELLVATLREAGALALKISRTPFRRWTKGVSSPVSEADIAVDQMLRAKLTAALPQGGWLSEESEDDRARTGAREVWIVDPIDGTRAFVAGNPDWTISVALVADGRPVVAGLYAPVTGEMFAATVGAGATLNGAPIRANAGDTMAGTRVAGPKRLIEKLTGASSDVVVAPRVSSLALRFARVAHGALDAALSGGNSHDWDLAAADLLVHEASGTMTTLSGRTLTYNRPEPVHGPLVAAGRDRSRTLIDIMREPAAEAG